MAITTSAKALYRFVRGSIVKSPVKYHDDDFPRTEFDYTALFFYKPSRYRFEREFRMLLTPEEHESISYDDEADFGRRVPILPKRIIHRVITHPRALDGFKVTVESQLRRYLKGISREDSNL